VVEEEKERLAAAHLGSAKNSRLIKTWPAKSDLIKGGGLPYVLQRDKAARRDRFLPPGEPGTYQIHEWTKDEKMPARVEQLHFFADRDHIRSPESEGSK
ncbi:MAG TPA: hypothetical protein VK524_32580, partial [Polyangiaceae bacterium]|nr:hypothetical protein [Polyangiaceae bacterium]